MERIASTSAYAGLLLGTLGLVAWTTGHPFVFPSLGPTAFVLALAYGTERTAPRRVVGGHVVGTVAGLLAYHAVAPEHAITTITPAMSVAKLELTVSAVASMVLTVGGMLGTDTVHPPACATTLIVSLGLLSTVVEGVIIVAAVILLYLEHALLARYVIGPRHRVHEPRWG